MSNTVLYIAAFVVLAHFVVGVVFLIRKFSGTGEEPAGSSVEEEADN